MAKPVVKKSQDPVPTLPKPPISESFTYMIAKYGQYDYRTYRVDPETQARIQIGESNVFAVVASDMIDLLFIETNPGYK